MAHRDPVIEPRLSLNPAPPNNYEQALAAAMEAIGLAVNAKLQQRDDNFRFAEVGRLARIGEAIGRQKARASQRVEDYVAPQRRAQFQCGPGVGMNYGGYGHGNLGGVDPLDDDLAPGIGPYGGAVIGNAGIINPVRPPAGDDGNPMAAFREVFDRIQTMNEDKSDSRDRLDRLEELRKLRKLLADKDLADDERAILEERRGQVVAELKEANEPEEESDIEEGQPGGTVIRCLNPECGNAHDADWVTEAGQPRQCDICNGPMMFAPARTVGMGADLAAPGRNPTTAPAGYGPVAPPAGAPDEQVADPVAPEAV